MASPLALSSRFILLVLLASTPRSGAEDLKKTVDSVASKPAAAIVDGIKSEIGAKIRTAPVAETEPAVAAESELADGVDNTAAAVETEPAPAAETEPAPAAETELAALAKTEPAAVAEAEPADAAESELAVGVDDTAAPVETETADHDSEKTAALAESTSEESNSRSEPEGAEPKAAAGAATSEEFAFEPADEMLEYTLDDGEPPRFVARLKTDREHREERMQRDFGHPRSRTPMLRRPKAMEEDDYEDYGEMPESHHCAVCDVHVKAGLFLLFISGVALVLWVWFDDSLDRLVAWLAGKQEDTCTKNDVEMAIDGVPTARLVEP